MLQWAVVLLLVISLQLLGCTESVAADRKPRVAAMEPVATPSGGGRWLRRLRGVIAQPKEL